VTLNRIVLKPHTFSDGTHVPIGTMIGVPTMPHQLDGDNYANPLELDPFRFEHAKDGEATRKYFTSVDSDYIPFGLGTCTSTYHGMLTLDEVD
jgi:cytochrome P450